TGAIVEPADSATSRRPRPRRRPHRDTVSILYRYTPRAPVAAPRFDPCDPRVLGTAVAQAAPRNPTKEQSMNRSWGTLPFVCALALAGCAGGGNIGDNQDALAVKMATGSFHLIGVTSDNYAIVQNITAKTINAVKIGTNVSTLIVAGVQAPGTDWPVIYGQTALIFTDATADGTGAKLTAWTAANGPKLLSPNAELTNWQNGLRVSRDAQIIAFWDHVDAATD